MGGAHDRLGDLEIIKTGTLLARQGDVLLISVPEMSRRPLSFSVEIAQDFDNYTEYEDTDIDNLYVKLVTDLNAGSTTTSSGNVGIIKIRTSSVFVFYFNYAVHIIGDKNDYIYSLIYNVVCEPV